MNSDERPAIERAARAAVEAFNAGDLARLMCFYGERFVDVNLPRSLQTHGERAAYYDGILKSGLKIAASIDEIVVDGLHAAVRGSLTLPDGERRYIELWEKQDGEWKTIWGIDGRIHP